MVKYFIKAIIACFFLITGVALTTANIYGLFQDIRPKSFDNSHLRFINDQPLSYETAIQQLIKNEEESELAFATRATEVISQGLAHIHWEKYQAEKFNQLVPIWENYFLYFMGKLTNIPEYKRYHFANYKRSLKRGIGVCGDASMILSQVLNKHDIDNKILTYPGHVVVSANLSEQKSVILDADFGVTVPYDKDNTKQNYQTIAELYVNKGYTSSDQLFFEKMYQSAYQAWNGVEHFITKKYYFEKISYYLKWPLPIAMILFSLFLRKRYITPKKNDTKRN